MKYCFLNYTLDTNKQELLINNSSCELTHVQYQLLLFLLNNPQTMFSKEEIFEHVWNKKNVTANSIDQIISKLRKILNAQDKNAIIKTVYAKGIIFIPEVSIVDKENNKIAKKHPSKHFKATVTLLILTIVFALLSWHYFYQTEATTKKNQNAVLFVSAESSDKKNNQDWLNAASRSLFDQLYNYQQQIEIKNLKDKPKQLTSQQFITNLWQTSPHLKVVKTKITQTNNLYNVSLIITDNLNNETIQTFTHQSLSTAIKQSSNWLAKELNLSTQNNIFIPKDSYLLELYMHGLSSMASEEFDKAEHYFSLCLKENNNFNLARLQLALVKRNQGQLSKALALLDTLKQNTHKPELLIEIATILGDIYDTKGKYQQARDIYLESLQKYQDNFPNRVNPIRLNLAHTYTLLNQYQKSLEQLEKIQQSSVDTPLLSHVLQKKASILLNVGRVKEAQIAALKSLDLFEQQQDMLGKAKIYSTLSRISTHQSKYKESLQYLKKALVISKGIDYKLGTGAILNEMIYLLLVQGKYTQAWQANLDMEKIAIDIGYDAMLQISKQYAVDISRVQKKWKQAEIYLADHLQFAQASQNKKALIRNKVLALDLYLDENKLDKVLILFKEIQNNIYQSKEVRLQSRLDKQWGRYYFLTQQDNLAIESLMKAKKEAQQTEDGETLIEINNLLAEHYIKTNQIQKAQATLEAMRDYNPLPYPYLLLKSKVSEKLGKYLNALDLANECKISAYENWTQEDDIYINHLKQQSKNQ